MMGILPRAVWVLCLLSGVTRADESSKLPESYAEALLLVDGMT